MNADVYFILRDRLLAEHSPHSRAALNFLHTNCLVFARANPGLKRRLINEFRACKEKDAQILFVGTDPNDAEAIEAADISLLMKKSHLSFKATFTANDSNFDSVAGIIREGKCSTESGFLTFKFFIFVCSLQLYRFYILGHFFIVYSNQMAIVVDFLVNLFIIEYITVFKPKSRLDPADNFRTIYNRRFFLNLLAHCLSGVFVLATAYEEMRDLSYYREPFHIIPYQDQLDLSLDLSVHRIYEGTLFFFVEILLTGIFFLITNFRSNFRVPLIKQSNAFFYAMVYIGGFGWTAMLSSKDEPSWFEKKFLDYFNSPKTYKTNEIYLKGILIYCFLGVMIEQFSAVIYSYFDQLTFMQRKPDFIQCEVEEAEPVED
jgi:magnesium-transporting ATPase (P-type)